MYLLLLVFGGLLGAAGVVLAGSGMSLRDGTFDAAILTPGIVAAAGGLLLIGLGAGLRTLQRIERTLAARPMPGVLAIAEGAKLSESVETPREPARIPFAPKAIHESQPGVAARDIVADKSPTAVPGADKASPPIPAMAMPAVPDANVETIGQPGFARRQVCGARAQANANRSLMRCGRKARVQHAPSMELRLRSPRAPA
jgi:hypothetical protein